ncbi:2-succinyl-5-enolpyruvyl-6-hydroxy-3-cyclohexene-1-carboxylate synthase [Desulfatibacillum alkenivorans DSM 16219]|jgi:2-succinyl-5-enolpyruvyl-6-hydroxy-3-cyclohexene-1-carboxylate synthase|uniref:2-succinyl-5-enolpyruvyl-6-hydroxy-3-cyclohexene-1-carboxylate synthase n=1 Tax=Desulfatibacillum alkenivorans DSM 16219 TaxID=1121393 RepID=A0A1M6LV99_9BACT|nr:2-succinyl-5-enolpyruvyl-6-hydroxy-3-cyclohexene-1-carboxylic-acid synthase [Desulfatibacillum alkenivorans]SHJ75062.1 2-succinyl-5-enolpyruvyl-6-hydroxy-3-cyclohexene-1-carboxylate synthase [Desulfatibacillum alkenivorans DSM 16219]
MALLRRNMNVLWSSVLVEELRRNGLDAFFVSPGNRNAPLVSALAYNDSVRKFSCMDERGAAYRALGYAKATGKPGVLTCTSGTALANYHPAVIEAFRDELPLMVISADRPPELTGSDANQTIYQENLYGAFCLESLNLPCPDPDYPLDALAAKICHIAQKKNGPVHINIRFRDPLIPMEAPSGPVPQAVLDAAEQYFKNGAPAAFYPLVQASCPDLSAVESILKKAQRGLLVIGRLENNDDRQGAAALAPMLGWPVFCDIASSLKGAVGDREIFSLDHPKALALVNDYAPDVILQLGSGLVSKHYYAAILKGGAKYIIQVCPRREHRDPSFKVNIKIKAGVGDFFNSLDDITNLLQDAEAAESLVQAAEQVRTDLTAATPRDALSFPLIAGIINQNIPGDEALFPGNSNAIRAFDMAWPASAQGVQVVTNRGVSGIEGNLATSLGFAEGSGKRVTAVIGDVSMLHDLNSLAMVSQSQASVILIIVNNRGGRIFERLPIRDFPEIADPMMTTPHGFDFSRAAAMFSLPYAKAETPDKLKKAYKEALSEGGSRVIEVMLDPEKDLEVFTARKSIR